MLRARPHNFDIIVPEKSGDKKVAIKDTNKKEKSKKTEMQLEIVLKFMKTDKEYKTSEIADILDLKGSRVRKLLAMLVEEGKIEALGGNRNRRYTKKLM